MLTVNPSAFLFEQVTPQPIINQSNVFNLENFTIGLNVSDSKSLLLVGGDIVLEASPVGFLGGGIAAPSGRIELGGIAVAGAVEVDIFGDRMSLRYVDDLPLANVLLNSGSRLDVSNFLNGDRAGSIVINSNSLSLIDSTISSETFGLENSGDVVIQADESVILQNSSIRSNTDNSGTGGSLNISTKFLSLDQFSGLNVSTFGTGSAGEIILNTETLLLNQSDITSESLPLFLGDSGSIGDTGEIQIQADIISLDNTSKISTRTGGSALDINASGNLSIEANDAISLAGGSLITSETLGQRNASDIGISTRIFSVDGSTISAAVTEDNSSTNATGQGGEINIETQLLSLNNNAQILSNTSGEGNGGAILIKEAESVSIANSFISTETSSFGDGGDIDIDAARLVATEGARISATATAAAPASTQSGDVKVSTTRVDLSGQETGFFAETQGVASAGLISLSPFNTGEALTVNFQERAEISAATSGSGAGGQVMLTGAESVTFSGDGSLSTQSTGSGPAGDISIETAGQFRVQDGARVEVSGESTGDSGTLEVISGITILDDGQLLASTQAGEDGNIRLQIKDALVLRGESLISAEAFNDADGGNVDIATPFIIALFPEGPNGSDIQASAIDGDGGRISIQANTLFNIAENLAIDGNMTNDLDASSGTGIDGEVVIETLEIDPTQGTATLPTDPANPKIAQGCQASGGDNGEFINSGRRGIPPNPYEPLSGDGIQEDIYPAGQTLAQPSTNQRLADASENTPETLIEAQGWSRNTEGDIVLLAEVPESLSLCQRISTGAS
ncbi:MAG: hypothetical protein AAFU84_16430 [Cyanobacteria bacterium J06633_23]